MLERHYNGNKLIKSFEFNFSFCVPGSTNSSEFIYELPTFTPEEKEEITSNPYQVKSDTFFFHKGKLIVHNKVAYNYTDEPTEQDFKI